MTNTEDLKTLWSLQHTELLPDPKELFKKALRSKNKMLYKLIFGSLLLVLTILFLISVWLFLHPRLFITKLGIALMIVAIGLYLAASQGIFELLFKKSSLLDINAMVRRIHEVKQKQKNLQGWVLLAYFILLSAGIFLYMIEYTLMMQPAWRFFSFGLTLLWILFNWFYIRPRTIRKQQAETDLILDRLEQIHLQLEDKENQ